MREHRTAAVTVPNVDLDVLRVQYQAVMKLVDLQRDHGPGALIARELDSLEGLENLLSAMVNAQQGVTHAQQTSDPDHQGCNTVPCECCPHGANERVCADSTCPHQGEHVEQPSSATPCGCGEPLGSNTTHCAGCTNALQDELSRARGALDAIHSAMSGAMWSPETLDVIADVITSTGRKIAPPENGVVA